MFGESGKWQIRGDGFSVLAVGEELEKSEQLN